MLERGVKCTSCGSITFSNISGGVHHSSGSEAFK